MKVLAVTPLYPPNSRVGAWLATHRCLAHLVERGHEVTVLTTLASETYEHDGVRVAGGKMLIAAMMRSADLAVSHLGDNGKCAGVAATLGVPSVRMVHGGPAAVLEHRIAKSPTALAVFNSRASRSEINWQGPSIVIPPPVDPELFRTTPGDRVTLVNLSSEKGGDLFAKLARRMPEERFLGVRGGYGRQRTMQYPNVETIPTTQNMRDDVYARTRVLLMPSEAETWGMVGIEAMCSGIPVIAHPTPGLRESLGGAGIFVDRADTAGWVEQITRLQDPVEWAEASAKALARVAELDHRADLDRFAEAVEGLVAVAA